MDQSTRPPGAPLWLRFLAIGVGIFTLLWLPIEDTSEITAIIFAVLIVGLFALHSTYKNQFINKTIWHAIIGALSGTVVIPIALFLAAFKTGLHQHGIPDFSTEQVFSTLSKMPYFVLGGLSIGLGNGIWQSSRKPNN
ncbi:MAG: hypothetical protein ISR58_09525 [Anaerolineales bacterium]|nr:hypothetical protein [Chloroflexota bacterium]MBL6981416.1 hypothetical protein [Anaerolineales bacterium]